jgi:hypothetical protein
MNTGPSISAAHRMAAAVSIGSAGTTIVMLSMARSQAMSSIEWWVGPSSPYAIPGLMPQSFTLRFEYATSALICSSARPVRKQAAADTKAILPPLANPAATPTMSCSAMPTLISRSGKALLNASSLLEPTESFTTPTMRWFSCANSARVST